MHTTGKATKEISRSEMVHCSTHGEFVAMMDNKLREKQEIYWEINSIN
jgi:hypothetical protein